MGSNEFLHIEQACAKVYFREQYRVKIVRVHTNRVQKCVQTNFALARKSRHSNRYCACANVHEPSAVCDPSHFRVHVALDTVWLHTDLLHTVSSYFTRHHTELLIKVALGAATEHR